MTKSTKTEHESSPSWAYLLVDPTRCSSCLNCMLACSLAHDGRASLSHARIQIIQSSFLPFPHDVVIAQCRQCVRPSCVEACRYDALTVDVSKGNLRIIDRELCRGCRSCMKACPYLPSRISWDPKQKKALKCDLCTDTPHWSKEGGAEGKPICAEVCPSVSCA